MSETTDPRVRRPSTRDVETAYYAWMKETGRSEDFVWFVNYWSALPGLRRYVETEASK